MRRLLALVCGVILIDMVLYTALGPLLPRFASDYGLSKTAAGVIVGAYPAGVLIGAVPAGVAAARFGPRGTVVWGLVLMAAASVTFAFAATAWALGGARLLQGFASALTWAGGLTWLVVAGGGARRGELLGTAFAAATVGAVLGPVVGAAADAAGLAWIFSAVAAGTVFLLVWSLAMPPGRTQPLGSVAARRAFTERRFVGGLWLTALAGMLLGLGGVLIPLELAELGFSALMIAVLIVLSAVGETIQAPLIGRFSDRRGRLLPVRIILAVAAVASLALVFAEEALTLAPLVIIAVMAYSAVLTPGTALLSEAAEGTDLAQGLAFGLMNGAWAVGNMIGPAGGGALADAAGEELPFTVAATICAITLLAVMRPRIAAPDRALHANTKAR